MRGRVSAGGDQAAMSVKRDGDLSPGVEGKECWQRKSSVRSAQS